MTNPLRRRRVSAPAALAVGMVAVAGAAAAAFLGIRVSASGAAPAEGGGGGTERTERLPLAPCEIPAFLDAKLTARCGTYWVWEDREARRGRRIDLAVVVLPALGTPPAPDPVFALAGGPGQAAADLAPVFALSIELRREHDIVLVDQRGTGGSHRLACHFYGEPPDLALAAAEYFPRGSISRCRAELEKSADLRLYTTEIAMDDLDEVRAALGYAKIDLDGGSYGSRAAQVYLRRHGDAVRAAILESVVPVDEPLPLHHAWAGQRATDLLLAECAANAACKAAYPKLAEELRALMDRVDRRPEVIVDDPSTRQAVTVRANRGLVAEGLRYLLYSGTANELPRHVHRAAAGDLSPLVSFALTQRVRFHEHDLAMGMFFSVTCAEDLPYIDRRIVARETAGTLLGDFRVREQLRACESWPRGRISAGARELVHSEVPTLLISGERDPATPPAFGERVAKNLPHSRHLIVPHGGHGLAGPCGQRIAADFLRRGTPEGLDTSCLSKLPAPTFAPPEPTPRATRPPS